jgi:hypothetical protein
LRGFSDRISTDSAAVATKNSLLAVPVGGEDGSILGALACQNRNGGFQEPEAAAITYFVSLSSIALEIERMKLPASGCDPWKYIQQSELAGCCIPVGLQFSASEKEVVCSMSCFTLDFEGSGHFKE